MRKLLLAVALAAASPALAAEDATLPGRWVSDATGEVFEIGRRLEVRSTTIGEGALTPASDKGANFKLNFGGGTFTSGTNCLYQIHRLRGERIALTVVDGPASCPRGSLSRIDGAPPTIANRGGRDVPLPPQRDNRDSGRAVRSADAIAGKWKGRDNPDTLYIRKSFSGWDINLDRFGQGALVVSGDSSGTVTATFGSLVCSLTAKTSDGELMFESAAANDACPTGVFTRVQ